MHLTHSVVPNALQHFAHDPRRVPDAVLRRRPARKPRVLLSICAALFALVLARAGEAQTARLAGEVTSFGSSLTNATGVAVDGSQNAYVVTSAGVIYKESFNSSTGTYTENSLFTAAAGQASSIAVDNAGQKIYVGTGTAHTVELFTGSGVSYNAGTAFSGFTGVATPSVDASGNVFIVDQASGYLYKETLSGSTYTGATLLKTLTAPRYVAVDPSGNVFIASTTGVFTEVTGSGSTYTAKTLTVSGITAPTGLEVDASDDLFATTATEVQEATLAGTTYATLPYYAYAGSGVTLDSLGNVYLVSATQASGTKLTTAGGYLNFGSVGPGPGATMSVAFTFTSSNALTKLGTPTAVTQGLPGYDFSVSGGTCAGSTFVSGNSCTVTVQFSPEASGSRLGALDLATSKGNKVATTFLGGVGLAPLAVYQSATLIGTIACPTGSTPACATALNQGRGLTIDPAGNIYLADQNSGTILEYPAGSQTPNTLASGLAACSPSATALDGEGNVYYTCNKSNNIYELVGGTGTPQPIPVGYYTDDHLSVDAAGNLYTTSYQPVSNLFLKVNAVTQAVTTIASAPASARFVGAVTDAAGNTFAPDYNNNLLYELPAGSSQLQTLYTNPTGGLMVAPHAIAEDAAGDLYVTTTQPGSSGVGTSPLLEFTSNNYSATPSSISILGSDSVAISANGNIYTVYDNTTLYEYTRGLFSLSFPNTAVGQISAAQTVTLANAGSAPLTIAPPSSGTNPGLAGNYIFDPSSTCPQLSPGSSSVVLGIGSTCNDVIEFAPAMAGLNSGTLLTTDNSANVAGSQQTISLSGTATLGTPAVTVTSLSGTLGQPVTLTTIVSGGGAAPTGTVTFVVGSGATVNATCTGGKGQETCTASYVTSTFLVAGANTITATVATDGNYASATGTGTLTLAPAPTSTTDLSSQNPSIFGNGVTFTATVTSTYGAPSGTVNFLDNGVSIGSATLGTAGNGNSVTATFATSSLAVGTHPITASYAGTTTFATSASGTLNQVVKQIATTNTDTLTGNGTYGAATTPLTVTLPYSGPTAPTGAITLTDSLNETVTIPASACTAASGKLTCPANLPTVKEPFGNNTITISQATDTDYAGSTGSGTVVIGKALATTTDAAAGTGNYGAPTVSVTVTIPYPGTASPTGSVTVTDALNETVTVAASNCSAASGTLTCTVVLPTVKEPVGKNTVTISQTGDGNYTGSTGTGTVTINPAAATNSDTAAGTGTYGAATTQVAVNIPFAGTTAPTGAITVTDSLNETLTVQPSTCSAASGVLSCTVALPTAKEPLGKNTVTVSQAADSNYAGSTGSGTVTINQAPATTADTASGTGTYGGATTTVTVAVPYAGTAAPTGNVTVTDALNETVTVAASTCTAAGGTLTCTVVLPTAKESVGNNTVSVSQASDSNYASSTGTGKVTISPAAATTADTASGTGTYGTATTTVTVKIPYAGTVSPTGAVTVTDSLNETLTVAASTCSAASGVLSCPVALPTSKEALGNNAVTISQAADGNYAGSTGTGTARINQAPATATDTATGTGTYGVATTPVTVSIPYAGTASPTGAVTVTDSLGETVTAQATTCTATSGTLSCTVALPTVKESVGKNTVSVSQAGDTNYAGSTGSGTITINPAVATTNDTATGTGTYGAATTAVTVSLPYAGTAAPTGSVTVTDSLGETLTVAGTSCTAASGTLSCTVNLPTSKESVGKTTVSISQAADANYAGSTGSGTVTINPATATANDAATGTGTYGAATTAVTVSIPYAGTSAPTGNVTVTDSLGETLTVQASSCTAASGTLSCTIYLPTSKESVGKNTVTISQAADANYAGSTGTGTVTINPAAATTNDTASGTGSYGTANTAVTVAIPYGGSTAPTGQLTVADTLGETVTVQASSCTASAGTLSCTVNLATAKEAVGKNTVSVSQAADGNYAGSTGSGTVTINPAAATTNDAATGTGTYGAANSPVAVRIPFAGPVASTGAITVTDSLGETVTVAASTCTASTGTLTCNVTLPTSKESVGANTVSISQAADGNYSGSTGAGTVTIAPAAATAADIASGTGTYGAATTPVTVKIPYAGAVAPTGAITVTDALAETVTVAASTCTANGGTMTCTASLPTPKESVGSNTVSVSQAADSNYAGSTGTGTVTLSAAPGSTADTASGTGTYGAATTPVVVKIPYTGSVAPSGAVTITDSLGETVTAAASSCASASGVLTCNVALPTVNEPVGNNALTVGQAADSNYGASTGSGTAAIGKGAAGSKDTATGSGTYGAATTPVTVKIPYTGAAAPSGSVSVIDSLGETATVAASSCSAASGTLTCVVNLPTANEPAGSNSVTAGQAADNNYSASTGTGAVTLAKAAATAQDTVSGNGTFGAATTPITVTIPYAGPATPSGAITVTDSLGENVIIQASACAASGRKLTCTANLPTASEPVGNNTVTVTQAGDANYSGSTGTGTVAIGKIAATNKDTASGSGSFGAPTTSVLVKIPYAGTTAPTGAITVTDSLGENITVAASTCTASAGSLSCTAPLPTFSEPVGNNAVTVSQAADANYGGSTGGGTVVIAKVASTTGDTASGNGTYGAASTSVIAKIPYAGPVPSTGSVTITDSLNESVTVAAASCTASSGVLSCTAELPTANEPVGNNAVAVSQAADSNYSGSTGSGAVTIAKAAATTNDTANGSGSFSAASTPVAVKIPYPGSAAPTGAITLADSLGESITVQASTCAAGGGALNCTINLPTAKEPVGNNTVTVSEVADGNYSGSTGTGTVSIAKIASTNADAVTGTGVYGAANTPITVTVPYAGAIAPTGVITVSDSMGNSVALLASGCTAGGGVLTCTGNLATANAPVGNDPVTVNQAADANYSGSIGSGTLVIGKAAVTKNDSATGAGTYGVASTPVKVTIPYAGTTAPIGAVTVTDTFGNTVTVQGSGCTASGGALTCNVTLPTLTEPVGANSVTVTQAADSNYSGSNGTGTVTISKATSTGNDTASGSGTYGGATSPIKVQIPFAGQTAPTGAITVTDTHNNSVTLQATGCTAAASVLTCTGSLPTANEPVGGNSLTVTEAADGNYTASNGTGVMSIGKAPATANDSASGTGTYGTPTTPVAVTIPFTGAATPAGAITLTDTHGDTVTVAATTCSASSNALSCTVSLPTANEPVGANSVTVTQADDANYSGSTGTGTITIGKAPATANDTATGSGSYGAATTTVTVSIPYAGVAAPTGAITVADSSGNTINIVAGSCTASGGALTCTTGLPTANEPLGSNPLTVSQAEDSNYGGSTGTGSVTIHQAGSRGDDSATGTGSYGSPTSSITVVLPYSGFTAPTSAITVADAFGESTSIQPTSCTASNGALVCTASLPTAGEPVGNNALTVSQAADIGHAASTGTGNLRMNPAATTSVDTATGSGTYGAASTAITVSIPYAGTVPPSGLVTVTDSLGNTASLVASACTSANGTLTCVLSLPTSDDPLGSNQLTVSQAGDSNYTGSTGTGSVTISMASVSPAGSTSGGVQNVTISQGTPETLLTSTLVYSGAVAPAGAVTFTAAGGVIVPAVCTAGASPETCTASYPTASLGVGTYTITVNEAADAIYPAGSATGTLTVEASAVSPILDTISNVGNVLVTAGTQSATLTANITYTGPFPTGGLTFSLPNGSIVTATCSAAPSPLSCTAAYPTASLAVGTYVITATEAADSNYAQGSATALLTVVPNSTTPNSPILSTGSAVNSVLVPYGTPTSTLSATIVYTGPAPTGAVTFLVIGGSGITVPATCSAGASPLTCTATYPTGSLGIGSYRIQLNEAGDSNYPAGSAIGTLTVTNIATSSGDTVNGTGAYGAATTAVTVNIPYTGAAAPSGAVTVTDSQGNTVTVPASSCTASAGALSCPANLPTANVPAGAENATVSQAMDALYGVSNGSGTLTITKAPATSIDTVTGTGIFGAATTPVNVTLPYAGALAPTGAITVTDSLGNTVTLQASACAAAGGALTCTANLPTLTEPIGGNPVIVSQVGDANYSGSTGSGTVTINKAGATNNDTATGTGTYGATTTPVTVTIPFSGPSAPTGAVTLTDTHNNSLTVSASSCVASASALTCTVNLLTSTEPVGVNPVTVSQAADPDYSGSTGSGTVTITLAAATNNDTGTGTGTYGGATTPVTVSIPFAGKLAPTGSVTVTDTHGNTLTVPASSCATAAGVLTCTLNLPTANEPAGTNALTVTQAADANYGGSTGAGSVVLGKVAVTTTDTASGTGTFGAATTPVNVLIPYTGAAASTGAITVADTLGNTVTVASTTCTAPAGTLACTVNLPTANEPVGSNSVTVSQAADSNYAGSTGTGAVVINKAAASGADAATGSGTYGAATTSVTITLPFTGSTAPTGAVTLTDTHSDTVTAAATSCTASGSVLTCTVALPTVNEPVGPNPVTVNQAADPNHSASTGTGTVTINKVAATGTDTATGSGTYGAATVPVTVTIPYTGPEAPTGAISLTDSFGNTVTVAATACTASNGTLTCTANLPVVSEVLGANQLTVAQSADANYSGSKGTGTITLTKAAAGNGDTATGTGVYGAASTPVTITIPYTGTTAPTGAVTLTDTLGSTATVPASGCTAAKGTLTCPATLPTANEAVGSNPVTVSQAPDAINSGSTGTGAVTITKAPATAADSVTGSGTYGAATTPVTVTIPYAGSAAPTGAITVSDSLGNTVTVQASSCTVAKGVLTCNVSFPTANQPAGPNVLNVSQAPDANYSGSTGSGSDSLGKTSKTIPAPAVSPLNAVFGTAVTLTETVPSDETGTVTFSNGSTVLGTATILNGTAALTTSGLPVGTASITASASGDGDYAVATSPATTDQVSALVTKVALVSSQLTSNPGVNVTFTATVTTTATGSINGTMTFLDGATVLGTAAVNNGVATLSTTALAVGTHPITASFAPASGSTLSAATSTVVTQTVVPAGSSVSLTSSLNPAVVEQNVTFTATVPASIAGTAPTGSVTFYDGTTLLGTAPLNGAGQATLTTAKMSGGMHNITAVYGGDTNYATSTSAIVAQGISDYVVGNTTPTISVDPGSTAAFNITVNPSAGVQFGAPVVLTVTGLPANFTAAFGTGTVTPGTAGNSSSMTVHTYAQIVASLEHQQRIKSYEAAMFWAFLFPLLGIRKLRKRLPRALLMFTVCLASFGVIAPLTGCGGGYFGPQPATYTLTVTGTSGSLQRSTTVTLNVR